MLVHEIGGDFAAPFEGNEEIGARPGKALVDAPLLIA
jgi:hypothetical protein